MRISGGEPTLCFEHLISVLDLLDSTGFLFILETNGTLIGSYPDYLQKLSKYRNIHVRVSLKAGTPEGFEIRTGGKDEFYELPFRAVAGLLASRIPFHVAAMTDPLLMNIKERKALLEKLKSVGYTDSPEEETCDPYPSTLKRIETSGFRLQRE